MSLEAIQKAFLLAIEEGSSDALVDLIQASDHRNARDGIAVYQNNTCERLKAVLSQTYPVCRQIVGDSCFEQLAENHIIRSPCQSHDLDTYGADFFRTVTEIQKRENAFECIPYLSEMAILEWRLHRAYFAPNRIGFNFSVFSQLQEHEYHDCQFTLSEDVSLLPLTWPVVEMWEMHQPKNEVKTIDLAEIEVYYVIERPLFRSQAVRIDKQSFHVLKEIQSKCCLAELLDKNPNAQLVLERAIQNCWIDGYTS